MAGPLHNHMARTELDATIIRYGRVSYTYDLAEDAIRFVSLFNNLQSAPLTDAQFGTYVGALVAKLNVSQPNVPGNLASLSDAQAVALADSLELANWDYKARISALQSAHAFYVKAKDATGAPPSIAQFRDTFLWMANTMRQRRGLADLT